MKVYEQIYKHGVPQARLSEVGNTKSTGTEIHFVPSPDTFTNIRFSFEILAKRLRELSFLNSGIKIILRDERASKEETYSYDGGLRAFVDFLNLHKTAINSMFHFSPLRPVFPYF